MRGKTSSIFFLKNVMHNKHIFVDKNIFHTMVENHFLTGQNIQFLSHTYSAI